MKSKRKQFWVVGVVLGASFLAAIGLSFGAKSDLITTQEESQEVVDAMNKEYAEDTYGGTTPEETIRLFTDALKKGDTALASMYFLPEDRAEIKLRLDEDVKREVIEKMLKDIQSAKITIKDGDAFLSLVKEGVISAGLVLSRSEYTGRWKITEF